MFVHADISRETNHADMIGCCDSIWVHL